MNNFEGLVDVTPTTEYVESSCVFLSRPPEATDDEVLEACQLLRKDSVQVFDTSQYKLGDFIKIVSNTRSPIDYNIFYDKPLIIIGISPQTITLAAPMTDSEIKFDIEAFIKLRWLVDEIYSISISESGDYEDIPFNWKTVSKFVFSVDEKPENYIVLYSSDRLKIRKNYLIQSITPDTLILRDNEKSVRYSVTSMLEIIREDTDNKRFSVIQVAYN